MNWPKLLSIACLLIVVAWTWAGIFLAFRPGSEPWRTILLELRPFYLPAVIVGYLCDSFADGKPVGWWRILGFICQVACWWLYKDKGGDDDRWKRRRRKVTERITQSGGRLVVVPEASS